MSRNAIALLQCNAIRKLSTGALKQAFEHPMHGKHCRSTIDAHTIDHPMMHLTAGFAASLEYRDLPARDSQLYSACEPTSASTNHNGVWHQVVVIRR